MKIFLLFNEVSPSIKGLYLDKLKIYEQLNSCRYFFFPEKKTDIIIIDQKIGNIPDIIEAKIKEFKRSKGRIFIYYHTTNKDSPGLDLFEEYNKAYIFSGGSTSGPVIDVLQKFDKLTENYKTKVEYVNCLFELFKAFSDACPCPECMCKKSLNKLENYFINSKASNFKQNKIRRLYDKI